MFAIAPDFEFTPAPGFWDHILESGPLVVLLHFLLAISVIVAVAVIARRAALPWMLLVSCGPYICASAAAHLGFLVPLLTLSGKLQLPTDVSVFFYPISLFNWGCILSLVLIAISFLLRRKDGISRTDAAQNAGGAVS